jgi:hypothetical protein
VAQFVAGEANKRCRATISPLYQLLAVVASSSLVLSSEGLIAKVVVTSPTIVPIHIAGARAKTTHGWKGWCIPWLLEGPVMYLVVGLVLLVTRTPSQCDGCHGVGRGGTRTTSSTWCWCHRQRTSAFVLLHPHSSLSHGMELLGLLDEHLLGHVLLMKCPSELIPSDVRRVLVGVTVVVRPRLGESLKLVNGECDTLLVGTVSKIQLGLNHPQPVVGIHRII